MELTYLGNSSFKIRFKGGMVLVTDPDKKQKADLVTVSCGHKDHGSVENISGPVKREDVFVVSEEGEYEVGGVEVVAIKNGEENLVMVIRQNGVTICHLGNSSSPLSEKQIEEIGSIDILLVPVGMGEMISTLSPSIAVPIYRESKELDRFLDKSSLEVMLQGVNKVKIDVNTLPENTKLVVLDS